MIDLVTILKRSMVRAYQGRLTSVILIVTCLLTTMTTPHLQALASTHTVWTYGQAQDKPVRVMALSKENPVASLASAEADQARLVREVSQNLLAVASRRPSKYLDKYVWPPPFEFQNSNQVNAYASLWYKRNDGHWERPVEVGTGKFKPHVVVYQALMDDLIEKNDDRADRLAFVLAHELSHLLLGHVLPTSAANTAPTKTLSTVFTAEQEHEADILGIELALGANYSVQGARKVWLRVNSEDFLKKQPTWRNYTSFEGVGLDHPSWTDRLALIDEGKAPLWKAMSAFENGVFFLNVQQFAAAEESFSRVIEDTAFPKSSDAWANLGYARLMRYFDNLDRQDVARFNVSQLAVGSFYTRPKTLEVQVKGIDAELWNQAVSSTKRALALKPDSTLAKANLGIAYLLSPTGRNLPEAKRYLEQAAAEAPGDKALIDRNRATVLINAAVALLVENKTAEALTSLTRAEEFLKGLEPIPALQYNRALALLQSAKAADRRQALVILRTYLETETSASLWWGPAYDLYIKLSAELKEAVKTKQNFGAGSLKLRPVTSVRLGVGVLITLSEPLSNLPKKLGGAQPVPAVPGTKLVRLVYPERGLEILAIRSVVAIFLKGSAAPPLEIRGTGAGSPVSWLKPGMSEADVSKVLGSDFQMTTLSDPEVLYRFYAVLGVAVHLNTSGIVDELVITQPTIE